MDTSRDDVGIAIRSAFLAKGIKRRFSLFILMLISVTLLFFETIETKPLNFTRSIIKDTIYRGSLIVSFPTKSLKTFISYADEHINLFNKYNALKEENDLLKSNISKKDFLELENNQLRKLIDDQISSESNLISARVMLDKHSPYLNSFIINAGANKDIKNGMAALYGKNFIGRIVDVNFFSARILLVSDLNSKIPVIIEPNGISAIVSGNGSKFNGDIEYLPEKNQVEEGHIVYTSGVDGIISSGIPIGKITIINSKKSVKFFADFDQIKYVKVYFKK